MDTTGCPQGLATDQTFLANVPFACDTEIAVFEGVMSTLVILRFVCAVLVWNEWWTRKKAFTRRTADVRDKHEWSKRIPFIPILSSSMAALWLVVLILVRFNQSNSFNGVSTLLWAIAFDGYALYSFMFQRRLIKLGKKIIPISRAKIDQIIHDQGGPSSVTKARFDALTSFDSVLIGVVAVECIAVTLQTVCGVAVGLVYPNKFVWLQVVYASEAVYVTGCMSALIYQLQRVYRCVVESELDDKTKAIVQKKFRSQQGHFAIIGGCGVGVNVLLAVGVFPSRWYTFAYWITIETSVSSLAVIDFVWSLCFKKKPGDKRNVVTAVATTAPSSSGNGAGIIATQVE